MAFSEFITTDDSAPCDVLSEAKGTAPIYGLENRNERSLFFVVKNSIKIYTKTAPTCFGTVTPLSGGALIRTY
jgi:hypothetical protein